jgi:arginase
VFAALRRQYGRVGLAFIDGHLDFYEGQSSPTGEAADMELAILAGFGPAELCNLADVSPLVDWQDVVVLGYRDAEEATQEGALDPQIVAPAITLIDALTLKQGQLSRFGAQVASQFEAEPQRFWLHLDLDVLDESVLPAVDYRMPDGLQWEEVAELVRPLAHSPALVGADVTIYNPALDPDGYYARQIVAWLAAIL